MRKPKSFAAVLLNLWRSPLLVGAPIAIALLVYLWWAQQSDVNSLTRRIRSLKRQIREVPTEVTSKKRLNQQISELQQRVKAIPALAEQKAQLTRQISQLNQQVQATADGAAVDRLNQQFAALQRQVKELPSLTPQKEQLNQELRSLKRQVDDLSTLVSQADRLVLEQNRLALEQDQLTLQNGVYGSLIQTMGALFFCGTAFFTWRYLKTIEEKQIIERLSQAIEHLGSDKQEIRVGGIYALERIAKDSEKDYWTVIEVLTSFVHLRCPLATASAEALSISDSPLESIAEDLSSLEPSDSGAIARDIQAALRVIGRREASKDPDNKRIDLNQTDLAGANLKGVMFRRVELHGADLRNANFREADLSEASLENANLRGAMLGLSNFKQANLSGADLSAVELIGGRLKEADLTNASLADADLRGVDLRRATLKGTSFKGTNLKGANLKGAVNLTQAQLDEAYLDSNTHLPEHVRSRLPPADPPEPQHL